MNDGVALLLERMKTNPEEFIDGVKWGRIISDFEDSLEEEDRKSLKGALNALMQQRFTEKIMEELVDPKSEGEDRWGKIVNPYLAPSVTRLGGQIPALSSITLEQTEHLRAHVDALKREVANQKPREHKTIFGKLFNYS